MVTLVIGHRGTGKSTFLAQLRDAARHRARPLDFVDLDDEISREHDLTIGDLFASLGEAQFRELEERTLSSVLAKRSNNLSADVVISLGAGYIGKIPDSVHVLWLSRPTDVPGRIFINRPRLNPNLTPLEEYLERWPTRTERYKMQALSELQRREGETSINLVDLCYLGLESEPICTGASLTLLPENLRNPVNYPQWLTQKLSWNFRFLELRTDLLSSKQLDLALQSLPKNKILFSFRGESARNHLSAFKPFAESWVDWDLDLGVAPEFANVLSLHARSENLHSDFKKLESQLHVHSNSFSGSKPPHLKFSPEISTLQELELVYHWWKEDQRNRSFLPRSRDGRWNWFRLWLKEEMTLNFVREGSGSALDQPTVTEWAMARHLPPRGEFGAVIGSPVFHSWSPVFHEVKFGNSKKGFYRVEIASKDSALLRQDLEVLERFGARALAVTSPLKKMAAEVVNAKSETAQSNSEPINTIAIASEGWWSMNTDKLALKLELSPFANQKVVMWGSGGMSSSVQEILPSAKIVSARRGNAPEECPEVLIWGVGRAQMDQCEWPPSAWKPKIIYDLNYTESSPGLEYALRKKCDYISGAKLFVIQAEEQQKFWQEKIGL